jgi:hypothetical protein
MLLLVALAPLQGAQPAVKLNAVKFNATKAEEAKGKVADAIKKAMNATKVDAGKVSSTPPSVAAAHARSWCTPPGRRQHSQQLIRRSPLQGKFNATKGGKAADDDDYRKGFNKTLALNATKLFEGLKNATGKFFEAKNGTAKFELPKNGTTKFELPKNGTKGPEKKDDGKSKAQQGKGQAPAQGKGRGLLALLSAVFGGH